MFKQTRTLFLSVAAGLLAAACQPDAATGPAPDNVAQPRFSAQSQAMGPAVEADAYVVEFGGSVDRLEAAVADAGGTLVHASPEIGIATVAGLDDAGAAELEGAEGIRDVTRDLMVQWTPSDADLDVVTADAQINTSDPTGAFFFPCQWNMTQANCPAAWAAGEFGDPSVKVAVLDSGVDPFHGDLDGRVDLVQSTSVLTPGSSPCGPGDELTFWDRYFHGTFVAGIITSNGFGVAGVAPDAMVVAVKTNHCLGSGSFGDLIAGIMYAANLPDVDVINMSLGAYFPKNATGGGQLNGAVAKAVNYANSKGVLVVSSAGNQGLNLDKDKNFVHLPSQAGSGIGAWAGDVNGDLASYSNYGRTAALVGAGGGDGVDPSPPLAGCVIPPSQQGLVIAPCATTSFVLPFSCGPFDYVLAAGTSFSAPLVSGVAALVDGQAGGSMNAGQLKTTLKNTADDLGKKGTDVLFSHGRVNAGNAVDN